MYIHSKLNFFVFMVASFFCTSCSNKNIVEPAQTMLLAECHIGKECRLSGEVFLYRGASGSTGVLEVEQQGCVALALSEEIFKSKKRWQSKKVVVRGVAFLYSADIDIISFEVKDRWVATGVCKNDLILYVDEIYRTK